MSTDRFVRLVGRGISSEVDRGIDVDLTKWCSYAVLSYFSTLLILTPTKAEHFTVITNSFCENGNVFKAGKHYKILLGGQIRHKLRGNRSAILSENGGLGVGVVRRSPAYCVGAIL